MAGPPAEPVDPDWDALAPFWHHFEHRGFAAQALSWIEGGVVPPCLYVGAGLGTYPARLADTLGDPEAVIMVDASLAMLRRRTAAGPIPAVCADGRALPFGAGAFATAVVATGVLDALSEVVRVAILAELVRVLRPDGVIVVALPATTPNDVVPDVWASLDAWLAADGGRAEPGWAPYDAVARELGDRAAAHRLLTGALPRYASTIHDAELRADAAAAGAIVTARLEVEEVALYRLTVALCPP